MKTPSPLTFYGLAPLCESDIDFFLTTPRKERGGAYSYEMRRQVYARAIDGRIQGPLTSRAIDGSLKEIDRSLLKGFWASHFKAPWSLLSDRAKEQWVQDWVERESTNYLRWSNTAAGAILEDPAPGMPGELVVMKIDWDLSDATIVELFNRSLKKGRPKTSVLHTENGFRLIEGLEPIRPRKPLAKRREKIETCLRAIAMQRVFDLRGRTDPEEFAAAYTDGKLHKKDQCLITLRRIDESKDYYRKLEMDTGIEDLGWSTFDDPSLPYPRKREHQGFRIIHALTR